MIALLLERIAEIRGGDTWRNLCAALERVKVVEYDRGEVRVQQTTAIAPDVAAILQALKVPLPPKLHAVGASAAADA